VSEKERASEREREMSEFVSVRERDLAEGALGAGIQEVSDAIGSHEP
jgi:hypothetical protein